MKIRRPMRRSTVLLSAAIALASPFATSLFVHVELHAQTTLPSDSRLALGDPTALGLSGVYLDSIGVVLDQYVGDGLLAGAVVGVSRHGRVAWLDASGVQDLESAAPMTSTSVFRIYSMTKAVTAVAAMILHEEGHFDLDDPVGTWLPQFEDVRVLGSNGTTRPPTRPITVRDLLFHTAGLSHRSSDEYRSAGVRARDIDLTRFVDNITRVPLRDDPGTRFRYSAAPTVLGRLVEIWSGQPLDRFMDTRIFARLGMTDTGFQVREDQHSRFTTVYRSEDGGPLDPWAIESVPFTARPALLEGAVGLVSTVPDFLAFAEMLAGSGSLGDTRIVSEATVHTLTTNGIAADLLPIYGAGRGWGAGSVSVVMDADQTTGGEIEGEYRWDGSAGTEFWVDPGSGTVLVTAWQNSPANPGRLRQRLRHLVREAIRR